MLEKKLSKEVSFVKKSESSSPYDTSTGGAKLIEDYRERQKTSTTPRDRNPYDLSSTVTRKRFF